jgi:hypothetical protein
LGRGLRNFRAGIVSELLSLCQLLLFRFFRAWNVDGAKVYQRQTLFTRALSARHTSRLTQLIGMRVRSCLILFPAERVGKFVCDSHVEELVERDAPFLQERSTASRHWLEERLLEERPPLLEDREGRTVRVAADPTQNAGPVLGAHQNPLPVAKRGQLEVPKSLPKARDLGLTGSF